MNWNSSEIRAGVDKWPETKASVTNIEQPYSNVKYAFLSVITYTYKDEAGEYWEGKYETRTIDLPKDMVEGSAITIRYNPKNPRRSWSQDDYHRAGFGRFQAFDYPIAMLAMIGIFLLMIAVIEIFHIHLR